MATIGEKEKEKKGENMKVVFLNQENMFLKKWIKTVAT